jgi:hypothetical protein
MAATRESYPAPVTKTSDYTAVQADCDTLLVFTNSATLTLPNYATAGDGWCITVAARAAVTLATASGTITFQPADAATSATIPAGTSARIIANGAGYTVLILGVRTLTDDLQSSTVTSPVATVDFTVPATGDAFLLFGVDIKAGQNWYDGLRIDTGAGFRATPGDYNIQFHTSVDTLDASLGTGTSEMFVQSQATVANTTRPTSFFGLFFPGSASSRSTLLTLAMTDSNNYPGYMQVVQIGSAAAAVGRATAIRFLPVGAASYTSGTFKLARIR